MRTQLIAAAFIVAAMVSTRADAQSGISLWLGGGRATNPDRTLDASTSHLNAGLQLDFPVLPVALRGEAMLMDPTSDHRLTNLMVSALIPLKLPVVRPYAIAGYGTYGLGKAFEARGIHYGGGVRVGVSRFGVYAEVRHHNPLSRTLATIGITM
jgi:hypothetical protein